MPSSDIAANLAAVKARIATAQAAAGRQGEEVELVAVGKTHPAEAMRPVLQAGHRRFGENRVQEAKAKWPDLRADYPDIRLHLIGPLQTNKVRDAVALFDVIETVDRERLAKVLGEEMRRTGRRPACYVEINTGSEPQKAGIAPAAADAFIRACIEDHGLPVEGVMCIPPAEEDPTPHFTLLAAIARRNGLPDVSMGMSGDFEAAIRCGATSVRVGTAIFGGRPR